MTVIDIILVILAAVTLIPVSVVAVECVAAVAIGSAQCHDVSVENPARAVVLVPSHNEEASIGETVMRLCLQLRANDRLLVVADNCTDGTAEAARHAGAEVVERSDERRRGKGYALAFGIETMRASPPDVVVIVDADCRLDDGALGALIAQAARTGVPAQGAYVMTLPDHPTPRDAVSGFAFLFKNVVRPSGLAALGMPCLLTGSGMAFPWAVIDRAHLHTGDIVEDMRIGIEMAIAGSPPMFCGDARVWSALPSQRSAAYSQRTRWEHGHLMSMLRFVPRLMWKAIARFRWRLLALALELGVPPLSLLVARMCALALGCGVFALMGESLLPLLLMGTAWTLLVFAVVLGWWRSARHVISFKLLLTVPLYLLWKLPMYARFLVRPQKLWVRTEREAKTPANGGSGA